MTPRRSLFHLHTVLALIVILVMALVLYRAGHPFRGLAPPAHDLQAQNIEPVVQRGRRLEHINLMTTEFGDIGIFVSLPDPLPPRKLPVIFVLGGLGTGENNIRYINNAGDNVIVGYDWPIPTRFPQGLNLVWEMPTLYRQVMVIPEQIASAIGWVAAQPWADDKHLSMLGYSLGALAAPAAENVAERDGHPIGWTILAYGGAPFGDLLAANPHMKPEWLRELLAPFVDFFLHPLEPSVNLPQLSSRFLVLEGSDDAIVPADARANLRAAVPGSKDVVVFNGNHMGVGPDQMELLGQIIRTSREWLIDNGAVNPP